MDSEPGGLIGEEEIDNLEEAEDPHEDGIEYQTWWQKGDADHFKPWRITGFKPSSFSSGPLDIDRISQFIELATIASVIVAPAPTISGSSLYGQLSM